MNYWARYKNINLLLKAGVAITTVIFIYYKLEKNFDENLQIFLFTKWNYYFLLLAFLFSFLNWFIESYKWYSIIKYNNVLSLSKAFQIVLTGISIGLLTPNRIGEIPARAYLLNDNGQLKNNIYSTFLSSFAQMLVTLFFGLIGLILTLNLIEIDISEGLIYSGFGIVGFLFFLFFYSDKIKRTLLKWFNIEIASDYNNNQLFKMLFLSVIRYFVFFIQYLLILEAFDVHFTGVLWLWLIPVCFIVSSSVPTFVLSEIGVRSSVALLVFGLLSPLDLNIIMASIVLWFINIGLPAIYGLFYLKHLKIKF